MKDSSWGVCVSVCVCGREDEVEHRGIGYGSGGPQHLLDNLLRSSLDTNIIVLHMFLLW